MISFEWNGVAKFGVAIVLIAGTCSAADTKVVFDIPSKVECRVCTPATCAASHPEWKVIEAKFRISAGFVDGGESSTVDFVYMISSPEMRLKVMDFLPNTTLESATADDHIEVTDSAESTDAASADLKVAYQILSLGGSKTLSNKKTESNHYQKLAPKNLVLASGTVNREHGVFYKLRPSHDASLEGAKEFAILCIVPRSWRGDWCTLICSARANKKSALSSSVAIAGFEYAHIGLYLPGDHVASDLADELTQVQLANDGLLSKHLTRDAIHIFDSLHAMQPSHSSKGAAGDWFLRNVKFKPTPKHSALDAAKESLTHIEERFSELAGKKSEPR